MAKLTTVIGARFEKTDPALEEFKSIMDDHGINQSTLTKLIFKYALIEDPDNFREWISTKNIIVN